MKSSINALLSKKVFAATTIAMLAIPTATLAQDVQLHARDGSAHMSGDLVSYEDGSYALNTELGMFVIAARFVVCEGDTCPSGTQVQSDMAAAGDVLFE